MSAAFAFTLTRTRRRARGAVACTHAAWRRRDAGVHAGRHAGRGEGVHASRSRRRSAPQIILGNTYHLYLRPGDELIARRGGLHRFIGWTGPILTDSGGYQVFSLADAPEAQRGRRRASSRTSTARGISLTPETAVDIQARLGSDIAMVFDECLALAGHARGGRARRWSGRCAGRAARRDRFRSSQAGRGRRRDRRPTPGQAQFGIVQGGTYPGSARRRAPRRTSRSASRLRDRRAQRRRADRRHVRRRRPHGAAACRTTGRAI